MQKSLLERVSESLALARSGSLSIKGVIEILTAMKEHLQEAAIDRTADEVCIERAIKSLSYSEEAAITAVIAELGGRDGLLVAARIADRKGITRSVVVNALRKLESAGVLTSRSLGMKGTRIKFLVPGFAQHFLEPVA